MKSLATTENTATTWIALQFMLPCVVVAGLLHPDPVRAETITVNNNSITLVTGTSKYIDLHTAAGWNTGLTYAVVEQPKKGALIRGDYVGFRYQYYQTVSLGSATTDSFAWCAFNGGVTSRMATCTITITSNNTPVARTISTAANSGVPAQISVCSNVSHAASDHGQTMTFKVLSQPEHGGAWAGDDKGYIGNIMGGFTDGFINYVSAPGFIGTDTFTWAVSDGLDTSAAATVTVTVAQSPPDVAGRTLIVLKNASREQAQSASYFRITNQTAVVVKNTVTAIHPSFIGGHGYRCSAALVSGPSHGTITVIKDKWFSYKPADGYIGNDSFKWKITYSGENGPAKDTEAVTCSIVVKDTNPNPDWTQWRFDECRSARSPMVLPDDLRLQWRRDLPACPSSHPVPPKAHSPSGLDYCRPVQLGKMLFVSLMANDSITAYDTDTGAQKWRYYTGGALRRPPAAVALANGRSVVIAGCDDGYVYCLNASDGTEAWKFRAVPNARKAMGCGRLGSVWPLWGSPVVYDGPSTGSTSSPQAGSGQAKVYFAAGFAPSCGIYIYCLDAATGIVSWRNDGRMMNRGGVSSLGPLAFSYDHTRLFGTTATDMNWVLDPATGEQAAIVGSGADQFASELSWFVDGNQTYLGREPMEITAGGRTFTPESVAALGVIGTVHSMLVGDGKLFVATQLTANEGRLYCFDGASVTPKIHANQVTPLPDVKDGWTSAVTRMLNRPDLRQGLALVWGVGSGRLTEELAKQAPGLMIVAADPDPAKLRALRVKMDAAGLSGARVSTMQGNPVECGFAPYQAALIVSEDVGVAGLAKGQTMVWTLYECMRPFGGEAWLPTTQSQHNSIAGWISAAKDMPLFETVRQTDPAGAREDGFTQIKRTGLPDEKLEMKPPFGLTAFGAATLLSPVPPLKTAAWYLGHDVYTAFGAPVYIFLIPPGKGAVMGSDVYSWLPAPAPMPGYESVPEINNRNLLGPSPGIGLGPLKSTSFPTNEIVSNPLYSTTEKGSAPSTLPNSCSGIRQYGNIRLHLGKMVYFGDISRYWGIMSFPEIGGCCSPFGFVGDGVMILQGAGQAKCDPSSFKAIQIGVTPMADEESWVWFSGSLSRQTIQEAPVRRVGVNFGAIGDRYLPEEQMLWTHHPYSGRPTEGRPLIPVSYRGNAISAYHHSAQIYGALRAMEQRIGNRYRGWVSASYVKGMDGLTVHLATPLVAMKTETAPVIDGKLTDNCWDHREKAVFPSDPVPFYREDVHFPGFPKESPPNWDFNCTNGCYVMLRYDAVNLYVAGGLRGYAGRDAKCLKVALNSRTKIKTAPALIIPAMKISAGGAGNSGEFCGEIAVPWVSVASAGFEKQDLVINVDICGTLLYGDELTSSFGPLYLDAARGAVTQAKPHMVRLYFAEMEDKAPGQRKFDVKLQGQVVLTDFDVTAEAGGSRREVKKDFQNVKIADKLEIDFVRKVGEPMLSGIEIIGTY